MREARRLLTVVLWFLAAGAGRAQPPEEQLYIAVLRQPPVVEGLQQQSPARSALKLRLNGVEAQNLARDLDQAQAMVVQRLEAALPGGAEFQGGCTFLINALFVRTAPEGKLLLEQDPDVAYVVPAALRYTVLDAANPMVKAEALWAAAGGAAEAGRGVKIAIVDSGIDVSHPMFRAEGLQMPAGFPKWDSGGLPFTNAKVIVARSYHNLFPDRANQKVLTPADEQGHGTRVAAVAAGRPVTAPLAAIQGMAPGAWLGNYKVFGTPGPNSGTTSAAVIKAVEDAVKDGMDVINLSLGGPPRPPVGDPEQEAIARAVQAGVVVVVAAGNEGPAPGSVTSPGTSPEAITVGAVSSPREFRLTLSAAGNPSPPTGLQAIPFTPGEGVSISGAVGPFPFSSIVDLDPSELACAPLPAGSLNGRMVLVRRGTCLFQDKVDHVFDAGARALVVYNHEASGTVIMQLSRIRGPAVMIERTAGEGLREYLRTATGTTGSLGVQPLAAAGDVVLDFSGRGPSIDGAIKPDLVSVGNRIYTANCTNPECGVRDPSGSFVLSVAGTSFATPTVAGASAVLRQLHPGWSPLQIKGLLVGSAAKTPTDGDHPAAVTQVGNGRLDLAAALASELAFDPVSWSLGTLDEGRAGQLAARTFQLTNLGNRRRTVRFDFVDLDDNPSVSFRVEPAAAVLDPAGSVPVTVIPVVTPPLAGGSFFGYLRVQDLADSELLTAPVWGAVLAPNPDRILTIRQDGGAAFTSLTAALAAAEPGNILEVQDDGVYFEQVTIGVNRQGIPLTGIQIRAAEGAHPQVDGSVHARDSATIRVRDVEGVTLQGLTVQGGLRGIEFDRASGSVVDSTVRASSSETTGYGISAANSRLHVFRSRVEASGGAAVVVADGSALIQQSVIEPAAGGIHSGHGVLAVNASPLALFDNRISGVGMGSGAQGVRLSASQALLRGNRIENGSGPAADGIFVRSPFSYLAALGNLVTGQGRSGIQVSEQAQADLYANRIEGNLFAGVQAGDGAVVFADRNLLRGNPNGVLATDSALTLQNTLVTQSTSTGIRATASSLRLFNTTVAGNGLGVGIEQPLFSRIANSIVARNTTDHSGLSAAEITHSLVGGTSPAGSGNVGGDPGFVDPEGGDFRLGAGSPAVDAGSGLDAPFELDLAGHRRTEGSRVDLGALESGSDFAPVLGFPLLPTREQDFLGIAFTFLPSPAEVGAPALPGLPAAAEVALDLHQRSPEGVLLAAHSRPLAAGTQFSALFSKLFSRPAGWIEIAPPRPEVFGFALLGDYRLRKLDGALLSAARDSRLVFADVPVENPLTRVFLINPHSRELSVQVRWTAGAGAVQQVSMGMAPGSMTEFQPAAVFAPGLGGWLEVQAPAPISGFLLSGDDETVTVLPGLAAGEAASELYGGQLAVGPDTDTRISLLNLGPAAEVTLEAFDEAGRLKAAVTVPLGSGRLLRAAATQLFTLENLVGWLRVRTSLGLLVGSLHFADPGGRWAAALPLNVTGAREFVFSHVAQEARIFTGIALLNPQAASALVSLEVFDPDGRPTGTVLTELRAGEKRARLLSEWVPGLRRQLGGFVRVRSTRPVVGFELFGSPDYLSAVPAQVLVR